MYYPNVAWLNQDEMSFSNIVVTRELYQKFREMS